MFFFKYCNIKITCFIWKWFLFLLFFSFSHFCFAQITPQPTFRNLTTDDGLPSSEVYEVFEDRQGFIWFATDNGVSRYDGYTFENYSAEQGLLNNVVFHFFEDQDGRIWINSLSGELYYLEGGRALPYRYNNIIKTYKNRIRIVGNFFFNEKGDLFLAMQSNGVLRIDRNGKDKLLVGENFGPTIVYSDKYALPVNLLSQQPTTNQGIDYLNQYKEEVGTLTFVEDYNEEKFSIQFPFLQKSSNTSDIKLVRFADDSYLLHWRCNIFYIKDQVLKWSMFGDVDCYPTYFGKTSEGEIFFSHKNRKGIRRYKSIEAVRRNEYDVLFDDYYISTVFLDSKGNYWFSTIGNGVFYSIDLNIKVYSELSELQESYITSFSIRDDSTLYYANQKGEFYLLNHRNGTREKLPETSQKLPILNIEYDQGSEKLWVAHPIRIFDGENWEDLNHTTAVERNIKQSITKMKKSKQGDKLLGSGAFGFLVIDPKNERIIYKSEDIDFRARTFSIFENSKQEVYVSNINGFYELREDSLVNLGHIHPAFQLRIEDIEEMSDGTMVLGTKGNGVVLWKNNKVRIITVKDGLYSNMIEHLSIDKNENIWIGTLNGLNMIKSSALLLEKPKVLQFGMAHGLPSAEISDMKCQGDTLWLATPNGFVLFPTRENNYCHSDQIILEKVLVNNEALSLSSSYVMLYDENNIQLEYLSVNLKLNGQIEYRYRLQEDMLWNYTYSTSANFINLAPGEYFFEVQAKDENGEWTSPLKVEFLIKKPFWETVWFLLLTIILIGSLIGLFINRYIKRIRRDNEIEKEMQSLKASALQAQMNPHFVFNCLNAIQSFIAEKESEKATRYLAKFAMLVRNNLNASVNKVVSLEEEVQTIENYLSFEKMRFQKKLNYSIIVDPSLNIYDLELPPLLTLPYVENAIIHGLLQTPRQGEIQIKYLNQGDDIAIEIIDNGLGIFQTQKMKKKNQLEGIHKSIGMSISKKMLEIFNERSSKEDLLIEELKNDLGEILGTRIMLKIKIRYRTFDS